MAITIKSFFFGAWHPLNVSLNFIILYTTTMIRKIVKNCIKFALVSSICVLVPIYMVLNQAIYVVEEALYTFQEAVCNLDFLIDDNLEIVREEAQEVYDVDQINNLKWITKGIQNVILYI